MDFNAIACSKVSKFLVYLGICCMKIHVWGEMQTKSHHTVWIVKADDSWIMDKNAILPLGRWWVGKRCLIFKWCRGKPRNGGNVIGKNEAVIMGRCVEVKPGPPNVGFSCVRVFTTTQYREWGGEGCRQVVELVKEVSRDSGSWGCPSSVFVKNHTGGFVSSIGTHGLEGWRRALGEGIKGRLLVARGLLVILITTSLAGSVEAWEKLVVITNVVLSQWV
jgi:hypothetical protein